MALPPLELFSLKEKPPCCRAAFPRLMVDFDEHWITSDRVTNDEIDSGDMIVSDCVFCFFGVNGRNRVMSLTSVCARRTMRLLVACGVVGMASGAWAQDTRRVVTEPKIPPSCTTLEARLVATRDGRIMDGSAKSAEDQPDTERIQKALAVQAEPENTPYSDPRLIDAAQADGFVM